MKKAFPNIILSLIVFTTLLNFGRVFLFSTYSSLFLFWNLFLGIIPYFIGLFLIFYIHKIKYKTFLTVVSLIVWLLFLPNAPYLITDLIHIGSSFVVPLWYDALLYISYAILGLFLFIKSLSHIESIFLKNFTSKQTNIFIYSVILLSSFGMYLGRSKALRFNSWEVFSKPNHIFSNIFDIFLNPNTYQEAYIFTTISFIFLSICYCLYSLNKKI